MKKKYYVEVRVVNELKFDTTEMEWSEANNLADRLAELLGKKFKSPKTFLNEVADEEQTDTGDVEITVYEAGKMDIDHKYIIVKEGE